MSEAVKAKWKETLAEYGQVALVVYFVIFGIVFVGAFIALQLGFEMEGVAGGAGTIGAAWLATKVTQPLRILATVALTPLVAAARKRLTRGSSDRSRPAASEPDPQAQPPFLPDGDTNPPHRSPTGSREP